MILPLEDWVWVQRGRQHHHTPGSNTVVNGETDSNASKPHTHHITNGGDVSDCHLVYSVLLTAIFIKLTWFWKMVTLRNEVDSQPRLEAWLPTKASESSYGYTEYHATTGTELGGLDSTQRRHGFILACLLKTKKTKQNTTIRQYTSEQWTGEVTGSRLLATTRKPALWNPALPPTYLSLTPEMIGSDFILFDWQEFKAKYSPGW